jgi:thioredoxin 1
MVRQVKTLQEFKEVINGAGNKLVVVDFWATWCGPCRAIAPKFEALAQTYTDVIFIKVDVDENEETSQECGITAMPTFQFYKNGSKVSEFKGADAAKLEAEIKKYK